MSSAAQPPAPAPRDAETGPGCEPGIAEPRCPGPGALRADPNVTTNQRDPNVWAPVPIDPEVWAPSGTSGALHADVAPPSPR